nr:MAG TPA: hypothetical protein [Caudoviricetes sp.]
MTALFYFAFLEFAGVKEQIRHNTADIQRKK